MKNLLNWKNGFNWEKKLDPTHIQIQKFANKFGRNYLQPRLKKDYYGKGYDKKLFKDFGDNGFFDLRLTPISQGLICHEIEAIDSGYRSGLSVQSCLAIHPINKFGTDEQKEKYLPDLISGEKVGCFGLSEAEAGVILII